MAVVPSTSRGSSGSGGATVIDYTTNSSGTSVSATTEGTANTIVSASAHTFDGTTLVAIEFYCSQARPPAAAGVAMNILLLDGATVLGYIAQLFNAPSTNDGGPVYVVQYLTPSAGSHTYSIRAFVTSGTGSIQAGAGGSGNFMPDYIRITSGT